jgi:predicted SAM-dependent methyltransferase
MLKRLITNRAVRLALRSVQTAVYEASRTIYRELRFSSNLAGAAHAQRCHLINVGCGDLTKDGWINLDAASPSRGRYYYNAVNPLPFRSDSIEHIHAEHFLEHLNYFDACQFIKECFRVLRVGGSFRVIVPDLERYISAYHMHDQEFFDKLIDLGGSVTPLATRAMVCNQMFQMGGAHKFAWDFETLSKVLKDSGFCKIELSEKGAIDPKYQIDGQDWWREVESLYVNASKLPC